MNPQETSKQAQRLLLPLYNLSCSSGDALTIERILSRQPGVTEVYANPVTEIAYIDYDPTVTNEAHLKLVIQRAGFSPREGEK